MSKYGFTLIEVIIAALILTLTVAGVVFIFTTEHATIIRTGRRMQAMNFARQTLEELKNAVGADTWPNAGDLGTVDVAIDDPLPAGDFRDVFNGTRSYTVTNIDADGDTTYEDDEYKEVTVEVNWIEPRVP